MCINPGMSRSSSSGSRYTFCMIASFGSRSLCACAPPSPFFVPALLWCRSRNVDLDCNRPAVDVPQQDLAIVGRCSNHGRVLHSQREDVIAVALKTPVRPNDLIPDCLSVVVPETHVAIPARCNDVFGRAVAANIRQFCEGTRQPTQIEEDGCQRWDDQVLVKYKTKLDHSVIRPFGPWASDPSTGTLYHISNRRLPVTSCLHPVVSSFSNAPLLAFQAKTWPLWLAVSSRRQWSSKHIAVSRPLAFCKEHTHTTQISVSYLLVIM